MCAAEHSVAVVTLWFCSLVGGSQEITLLCGVILILLALFGGVRAFCVKSWGRGDSVYPPPPPV